MAIDSSVALTTLAEAKQFLKIPDATSSEDDLVSDLVNRMSQEAVRYCGRGFVSAARTEYYDGDGCDVLVLKNYPVITLTSVNQDATRVFDSGNNIDADDMVTDKEAGMVHLLRAVLLEGKANVKVVYTAGYATIPHDLQHACLLMVLNAYKRHYQDQKIGIQSESVGDRQFTYSDRDIPKPAAGILDKYRRMGWSASGIQG